MRIVLSLVLCLCMVGVAQARPRRTYTSSAPVSSGTVSSYTSGHVSAGGSDQERCQAEADYMAANNITGHVWSCIGSFEGVGYGSSPNCGTCTPSGNMRLTGDASAQGRNGRWYRVRSWR